MRLALTISILALVACGGSDTASTSGTDTAADASAPAEKTSPVAAAPTGGEPEAPEPPAATTSPESQNCLDLVSQAKFQAALPVCMAALQADPSNTAVQEALATAKSEAAGAAAAAADTAAAADAAADAAAGGAADAAKSGLGDATGGVLGGTATE